MRVVLLHGPAIKASRIKLQELRSEVHPDNVMVFDKGEDVGTILTNLHSVSLFEGERLVVVENPPEDFSSSILDSNSLILIFWFDHEVSQKPVIEWVKKKGGEVLYFPEAKELSVFPFLDLLAAGDKKAFLEMDKLKKGGFDIHYLLTMVFYLLRNLVATPKNVPQFVRDKLQRQRKNFDLEKIKKLYKDILEIDFKIKSGLIEPQQAEFVLVNKFMELVVH